jgi:hypothetical protein
MYKFITTPIFFRENDIAAVATWPGPVGQFGSIQLAVDKTKAGTDIFFFANTGENTGEISARLTTTANVFQINLNSATLSPVTLNVCVARDESGLNCIQTVPVTIQATWTGVGTPSTTPVSTPAPIPFIRPPVFFIVGTTTQREATAVGSLDGQQLGQSASAFIIWFKELDLEFKGFPS